MTSPVDAELGGTARARRTYAALLCGVTLLLGSATARAMSALDAPTAGTAPSMAPVAAPTAAAAREDSCVTCHGTLADRLGAPVAAMAQDVHAEKGLSCSDCHGGDPTVMDLTAMAPERGFRGVPERAHIPEFCGRCHADETYMRRFDPKLPTDQLQQYWTSVHGQRLRRGDHKVATCVSCHAAHGILRPDRAQSPVFAANVPGTCGRCHANPEYMAEYKIPTDQVEKYTHSVHGEMLLVRRDVSAPACNGCHGNHGAFPPGATSVAEVCGRCHVNNAAFFGKSAHKPAFVRLGLPECATCHSNHEIRRTSDEMLGGEEGAVCRRCHEPGSVGHTAAVRMRDAIEHLKRVMSDTETMLTKASAMGMEVSDEQYALREEIRPQLIKVRTETHLGDPGRVAAEVDDAIKAATASQETAQRTLAEAWARRRNLVFPIALIVILMLLLYAKLRQLERRTDSDPRRR